MSTREIFDRIVNTLRTDGVVQISTAYRGTIYSPKHVDNFRITEAGELHVKSGRTWNCIALRNGHVLVKIQYGRKV